MEEDLRDALDRYAVVDGVKNASVWAREALAGVVALGGLQELEKALDADVVQQIEPHPARSLVLQSSGRKKVSLSGECLHPLTARQQLPFGQVCRLCGGRI